MTRKSRTSTNPKPVRFDDEEAKIIERIQAAAKPKKVSLGLVVKRAVRFAGPKILSGEVPLMEEMTLSTKRA